MACRNVGTLYAVDKDGWRDGAIVELRGFTHVGERGKTPSPVTYYWFTQDGGYVEGKHGHLSNLKGGFNIIGPDNSFTGRLAIDGDRIPAGHYKILFRVHVDCMANSSLYAPLRACSNNRPPVELPQDFHVDRSKGPTELVTESIWSRSEFASVEVDVRPANERPAPDTSGFRLTCQDDLCREGSSFAFTTGGPFRELREGGSMGCITFRRKGKDPRVFGNAESKQLFDEKGMPSIVRNGGLSGKGPLPGAGSWIAAFECLPGGKSVPLGEITVAGKPDVPPVKETVEPAIEVTLSPPRGDQEPGFTMPEKGAIYSGSRMLTDFPKEVTYVSGMELSSATLAAGGPTGNSCGLRIRRSGSRTVQMLGNDRWLEGSLRFAGPFSVPVPPIRVMAKVPAELTPGSYTAELLCPQAVHSDRKRGNRLSATTGREPCIQLPKAAKQGEPFDAYIGGFLRNEQLVVNFGGLFEVGKLHQESALVRQPIRVPRGIIDGRYHVSVAAVSDPARTAGDELDVRGGYRQPTLRVTCPRGQPDCDVPRFKPGESVNTTGMGWIVKGRFEATLISERGKQAVPMRTDGCVWGILGNTPAGKPCDEVQGEIDKFWVLPMDAAGGAHVIEVTDGMAVARAGLWIEAGQAPEPKPPPTPRPDPTPGPAPKVCNPDLPRLWQPGCDPNRPRYAQPGCVESEQPKGDGSTPSPQKCNPNVPRYTQPGCIP